MATIASTPSAAPAVLPAPAGPLSELATDWHWLAQHRVSILILATLAMGEVYLVEGIKGFFIGAAVVLFAVIGHTI